MYRKMFTIEKDLGHDAVTGKRHGVRRAGKGRLRKTMHAGSRQGRHARVPLSMEKLIESFRRTARSFRVSPCLSLFSAPVARILWLWCLGVTRKLACGTVGRNGMENIATMTSLPSAKETAVAFRDKRETEKETKRGKKKKTERELYALKHPS